MNRGLAAVECLGRHVRQNRLDEFHGMTYRNTKEVDDGPSKGSNLVG